MASGEWLVAGGCCWRLSWSLLRKKRSSGERKSRSKGKSSNSNRSTNASAVARAAGQHGMSLPTLLQTLPPNTIVYMRGPKGLTAVPLSSLRHLAGEEGDQELRGTHGAGGHKGGLSYPPPATSGDWGGLPPELRPGRLPSTGAFMPQLDTPSPLDSDDESRYASTSLNNFGSGGTRRKRHNSALQSVCGLHPVKRHKVTPYAPEQLLTIAAAQSVTNKCMVG